MKKQQEREVLEVFVGLETVVILILLVVWLSCKLAQNG